MAKQSLEYSSSSLNLSLNSYDSLIECFNKAYALTQVALSEHFASCSYSVIHDYLWILEELIEKARALFEELWRLWEDVGAIQQLKVE